MSKVIRCVGAASVIAAALAVYTAGNLQLSAEAAKLSAEAAKPPKPEGGKGNKSVKLISPENGEIVFTKRPILTWKKVGKAASYTVNVSQTNDFNTLLDGASVTQTSYPISFDLIDATEYFWRVNFVDRKGKVSAWSEVRSFTVDTSVVLKRHPYLQSPATDSAVIAWTTTSAGTGEVQYSSDGGNFTSVPANTTFFSNQTTSIGYDFTLYESHISGLTPNATYVYKIFVNGADLTPSGPLTFTTAPQTAQNFSFIAFGDSGGGSATQRAVRDQMLLNPVDLYVHTGDVAYDNGEYLEIESNVFDVYRALFDETYFNPSLGNHDYHTNSGQPYLDSYILPQQALRSAHNERYYSFDWGNTHFIALDSNDPLSETDSSSTDDIFDWLRSDLQAANDRGMFWKIVYFHHPAFSSGSVQGSNTRVQLKLVPIFEQFGVDLVLNGHDHTYERTCPINRTSFGDLCTTVSQGGITYIVTGGGGRSLYPFGPSQWFTKYAESVFHFTKVAVQGCSLQTQGVKTDGSVFDLHTIDRCTS